MYAAEMRLSPPSLRAASLQQRQHQQPLLLALLLLLAAHAAAATFAAAAADHDGGRISVAWSVEDAPSLLRAPRAAAAGMAVRRDKCRDVVQREMKKYQETVRRLTSKISSLERDLRNIFEDKRRQELVIGELRDNLSAHALRVKSVMSELNATRVVSTAAGAGGDRRLHASSAWSPSPFAAPATAAATPPRAPSSGCEQLYSEGPGHHRRRRRDADRVIALQPDRSAPPFEVLCHPTEGNGWIVVQRRTHGLVNFNRGWEEYKKGFGELSDEFWLGNDKLHLITGRGDHMVRFEMEDLAGNAFWAEYNTFQVEGEAQQYRLRVSGYRGDAGDSLLSHHSSVDGARFSTIDRDNDAMFFQNCADVFMGGWWYNDCRSHINGEYAPKELQNSVFMTHGVIWSTLQQRRPLQSVVMMVRRRSSRGEERRPAPPAPAAVTVAAASPQGRLAAAATAVAAATPAPQRMSQRSSPQLRVTPTAATAPKSGGGGR